MATSSIGRAAVPASHDPPSLSQAVLAAARGARVLLTLTGDGRHDTYTRTRDAAVQLALEVGAEVVFYDRSAESRFLDPYPSGSFSADVGGPHGECLLEEYELEALGRGYLRDQILSAAERGVRARAWLPLHVGGRGVEECVERFGVDLVIAPDEVERPSLVDRLRRRPSGSLAAAIRAPLLIVGADGSLRVAGSWRVDRAASMLGFSAHQFKWFRVAGRFTDFELDLDFDEHTPERSTVVATIVAASVKTGTGLRDRQLRSSRFLDANRHPLLVFASSAIEPAGGSYRIHGGLTIRDVQRPVILDSWITTVDPDAEGRRRVRFLASTTVEWRRWGIPGVFFVGPQLLIEVDVLVTEAIPSGGDGAMEGRHFTRRPE